MPKPYTILAAALLLLAAPTRAATPAIDDEWVHERVESGRFDELRQIEASSDEGSAVAMYWWGEFLESCLFGSCDPDRARALWMKSAVAGNGKARLALLRGARTASEFDEVVARLGVGETADERLVHASSRMLWDFQRSPETQRPTLQILKDLVASDPQLRFVYALAVFDGFHGYPVEIRAVIEAGFLRASALLRRYLLLRERSRYPQLLIRASDGDLTLGVALCDSAAEFSGSDLLPRELLPICESALLQGYSGLAAALLRHHLAAGNMKAAAYFAGQCESLLPIRCAPDLLEFHTKQRAPSEAVDLWEAVVQLQAGVPAPEIGKSSSVMQQAFSMRLRAAGAELPCLTLRLDSAAKKFDSNPSCPWRKAVDIPKEFRG